MNDDDDNVRSIDTRFTDLYLQRDQLTAVSIAKSIRGYKRFPKTLSFMGSLHWKFVIERSESHHEWLIELSIDGVGIHVAWGADLERLVEQMLAIYDSRFALETVLRGRFRGDPLRRPPWT